MRAEPYGIHPAEPTGPELYVEPVNLRAVSAGTAHVADRFDQVRPRVPHSREPKMVVILDELVRLATERLRRCVEEFRTLSASVRAAADQCARADQAAGRNAPAGPRFE